MNKITYLIGGAVLGIALSYLGLVVPLTVTNAHNEMTEGAMMHGGRPPEQEMFFPHNPRNMMARDCMMGHK